MGGKSEEGRSGEVQRRIETSGQEKEFEAD